MSLKVFLNSVDEQIDRNLIKFLNFYGITPLQMESSIKVGNDSCLFLNSNRINDNFLKAKKLRTLTSEFKYIFIYNNSKNFSNIIDEISNHELKVSCFPGKGGLVRINRNYPEICKELSGNSFQIKPDCNNYAFGIEGNGVKKIIELSEDTFFFNFKKDNCEIFLIACDTIIDLDQTVSPEFKIQNHIKEFLPILMFLKYSFGDNIWHTYKNYGCFIIDDPLLKKKYGFLEYSRLLSAMDRENFCTNIAFIPYNFLKTDNEIACLFRERKDRFSISLHGCDHCESEFAITDESELNRKLLLVKRRMGHHRYKTNIMHNNVMIFPQGKFSVGSLRALKANNFLAAINSSAFPVDRNELKTRNFFTPAINEFYDFPLFLRRYPKDLSLFALDLFMGKPLFIVEHHSFFRDGYYKICELVDKINCMFPSIKWRNPAYIIKNTYNLMQKPGGKILAELFSSSAIIKNNKNVIKKIKITKYERSAIKVSSLFINNSESVLPNIKDKIKLDLEITPKGKAEIDIFYDNPLPISKEPKAKETFKIFLRRLLTEIRDNYLSRNKYIQRISDNAKSIIKKLVA